MQWLCKAAPLSCLRAYVGHLCCDNVSLIMLHWSTQLPLGERRYVRAAKLLWSFDLCWHNIISKNIGGGGGGVVSQKKGGGGGYHSNRWCVCQYSGSLFLNQALAIWTQNPYWMLCTSYLCMHNYTLQLTWQIQLRLQWQVLIEGWQPLEQWQRGRQTLGHLMTMMMVV